MHLDAFWSFHNSVLLFNRFMKGNLVFWHKIKITKW
jgi:hypothetical protein